MIRGVHLDLKGLPPTPTRLLNLLDIFAAAKFNCVLVEWEDSFPWTVDARFRSETAYTPEQVDQFHRRARELNLQIIPLVQTLGHMETPLRLPEYAPLRELPDRCDGLNPLAAGARELVQQMVDDVLARSGQITHFHLGGDEHFTFGRHPDTRAYVQRHGKAALYLHHIEPLLDHLLARGIRPILWHDMMVDWDDASLARLRDKADVMIWSYRGRPDARVIERFKSAGLSLWGASAFKGADSHGDGDLPDLAARIDNNRAWAELVNRFDLKGIVATGWSRYQTHRVQCEPIDAALDSLVQCGAILSGEERDVERLLQSLGEHERFRACRDALSAFSKSLRDAGEYILLLNQQTVLEQRDDRRRGSGVADELRRLAGEHVYSADAAADDVRRAFADLVASVWIDRYIAERIDPLRQLLRL